MAQSLTVVARIDLSCGHFDALRAEHFVHRFPPNFHETFAIGVVEAGTAHIRTHRGEWLAEPGSVLAFSPGEIHAADSSGANGVAAKARDYLHHRWSKPLRLSVVAEQCGTTTFHLIRSFRRVMGVPSYAYLVQLRVNRAQVMLCSGSRPTR